jgi:HSP20 family molecular chaperone IbpA
MKHKMGLVKEVIKEIGNKSREFYEFVLPPVDMIEENDNLIIKIDIPGFSKKNIKLSIHENVLSINAKKDEEDISGTVIWKQRPNIIDKKIKLPMRIKEGEEEVNSAKYAEGVLTITIPIKNTEKNIPIQ